MSKCNEQITSTHVAADCATWADADRAAWMAAFDPVLTRHEDDRVRRRLRQCKWVRQTQYQNASVFTRYLNCAERHNLALDLHADGLRTFVAESDAAGCSVITIDGYVQAIRKVMNLIRPNDRANRQWLDETCRNFAAAAKLARKTGARRKVDSAELALTGEQLIAEARRVAGIHPKDIPAMIEETLTSGIPTGIKRAGWTSIQLFRDGLFLLVGAYAPERRRALASISLDQIDLAAGIIDFVPAQIKIKRGSMRVLPAHVIDHIVEWLMLWRPLQSPAHRMLWVGKQSTPPTPEAMYYAMTKVTRRILGFAVSPHDFRDAAATLVVEEAPQRSRLASLVLDHHSEEMTRNYTEQADQIVASRELSATISRTREATARQVRAMSSSTIALNPRSRRMQARSGA